MSQMKPVGSEKLKGDDKIKRIIELSLYKTTPKTQITESNNATSLVEHVEKSKTGDFYGIVREKDGYYVKRGLNESTLDYIGGLFMKNKNRFRSHGEALKRLNLLKGQDDLNEAKRYVLKGRQDEPAPDTQPSFEDEEPIDEPLPQDDGMDDVPMDDTDMGGEESGEESKPSDYMSEIQKFCGKLGQELRDQKTKLVSDDIKYVLNMIISAVDLKKLDENDLDDVVKHFERDEIEDDSENYEDEEPVDDGSEEETDLSEDDMSIELQKFFDTPFDLEDDEEEGEIDELDISQYEDLVEDDVTPENGFDIEKIKNEINASVMDILKKYK